MSIDRASRNYQISKVLQANHTLVLRSFMNKYTILVLVLAVSTPYALESMDAHQGFYIPTTFKFETVLDKLSIGNICQTFTFLAGMSLLYKAAQHWAEAEVTVPYPQQPAPLHETGSLTQAKKRASLRYLFSGCTFVATGFILRCSNKILPVLQRIIR
jgi:hypothetical protein